MLTIYNVDITGRKLKDPNRDIYIELAAKREDSIARVIEEKKLAQFTAEKAKKDSIEAVRIAKNQAIAAEKLRKKEELENERVAKAILKVFTTPIKNLPTSPSGKTVNKKGVKVQCYHCNGVGKEICMLCDGKGWRPNGMPCTGCSQTGYYHSCFVCHGAGYLIQ